MSSNADRLAAAVRTRRDELDLSQLEVWQSGGPSNSTLTEIENGRIETLTRTTARKLDAALKWAAGSAKAVWEGTGEAVPAVEGLDTTDARWLAGLIEKADLADDTRRRLLAELEEDERRRRA